MGIQREKDATAGDRIEILVVENNRDQAILAQMALEKKPEWSVSLSRTVEETSKYLEDRHFTVILTDYLLPDGNALDLLELAGQNSVVIIMTNTGNEIVAVNALQRGAYDYVVKDPLFYEILPGLVEKAIEKFEIERGLDAQTEGAILEKKRMMDSARKIEKHNSIKSGTGRFQLNDSNFPDDLLSAIISSSKRGSDSRKSHIRKEDLDSALYNCDRLNELIGDILELQQTKSDSEWIRAAEDGLRNRIIDQGVKRVLVVDDDRRVLDLITRILETSDMNLTLDRTSQGYKALAMCGEIKPDLLIIDIYLPECDVMDIIRHIKEGKNSGKTRILVVSGDHRKLKDMIECGADDYLLKPFDIDSLIEKVRALIGASKK